MNYYFVANDITTDKKKVAILFSACRPAMFKTIESVVDAETIKDCTYADLVKRLSEHYDPVPSSIVQRYKFYNRARQERENIADFVAYLREIAKYCDYKDTLNMMLRDRLVVGVNSGVATVGPSGELAPPSASVAPSSANQFIT